MDTQQVESDNSDSNSMSYLELPSPEIKSYSDKCVYTKQFVNLKL